MKSIFTFEINEINWNKHVINGGKIINNSLIFKKKFTQSN